MTTVQQAIADLEMTLPEVITGHVDGTALPVKKEATQHAVHFPAGNAQRVASLLFLPVGQCHRHDL